MRQIVTSREIWLQRAVRRFVILAFLLGTGCAGSARPVGRFVGHEQMMITAVFSSDGKQLVSIGQEGTVRIWDVASQRELARTEIDPPPRHYTMNQIAFSPDGTCVAFAARDNAICLWRWQGEDHPRRLFVMDGIPAEVRFSSDGRRVVAASGGYGPALTSKSTTKPTMQPLEVRSYDLRGQQLVAQVKDPECAPLALTISPDAQRFAVVCLTQAGQPARDLPAPDLQAHVSIRDVESGKELTRIDGAGNPLMSFSPDGNYLSVGTQVRDASTGQLLRELPGHGQSFVDKQEQVLVLEHGMGMSWGLTATPWIRPIRVDLKTGNQRRGGRMVLKVDGQRVPVPLCPPMSPDGRYILDYRMNLWRLSL